MQTIDYWFCVIKINGKKYTAEHYSDDLGKEYSYLKIEVWANTQIVAEAADGK